MMPVLAEIFRSVIEEFNHAVGVNPRRFLYIQPDLGWGHPQCSKSGKNYTIYLSAGENYWSKYIYQFAHEYCHFLIDGPLDGKLETTFWFEESICELASMFFLKKVTERWQSWFPVLIPGTPLSSKDDALLRLKQFTPSNLSYLDDLLKKNDPSWEPLYEWIDDNMALLSEPIYHRDMYNQIAARMYELFLDYPDLWRVIPCLQRPSAEEYTGFKSFAKNTLRARVGNSVKHLSVLIACLTGEA